MILYEDQADRISADGLIHDALRLKELQALPLYRKIGISTARIIEWYQHFDGKVYVSFSGGKDSTVLLHLVRSIFPDVPAVFSNTGLEYPELQKFVKKFNNVVTVYPKMNFHQVITAYGYPLISKEVAEAIYYARRITPPRTDNKSQTDGATGIAQGLRETYFKRQEFLGLRTIWGGEDENLNDAGKTFWGSGKQNRGNKLAQLAQSLFVQCYTAAGRKEHVQQGEVAAHCP